MERSSIPKPIPHSKAPFKKALVINLGCPKNLVETEKVCFLLNSHGISIVSEKDNYDAVFINTCSFLKASRIETQEAISAYYAIPSVQIVVFGCYATRYANELLKTFPDLILIPDQDPCKGISQLFFPDTTPSLFYRKLSSPYTAYLKIAEGCDRACAFCLIPSIKGPYYSMSISGILEETQKLCQDYPLKELVLVAQDTSSYGKDLDTTSSTTLINLLARLDDAKLVPWLRVLYLFPSLSYSFMDELFSIPSVLPYLDMPLQHVDPQILRLMNRPDHIETTINDLERLKSKHQDMVFRSTFIVGFPGETNHSFEKLCNFIKAFKYQRAGFFAYSDEADAPSYALPDKVPSIEKEIRLEAIYDIQNKISFEQHESLIGKTLPVLIEQWNGLSRKLLGRSTWDAPEIDYQVSISCLSPRSAIHLGQIVPVRIAGFDEEQLMGVIDG
jgi:ribosomal protein S12 methylthiotransferase